jgi:CubicO group peptidase (beta-lactamase class C family)
LGIALTIHQLDQPKKNMRKMRYINISLILFMLFCGSAKSDHEPPSYAYQATNGKHAVHVVKIDGHPQFTPLPRAKSKSPVDKQMDDIVGGFFSKSLAGIVLDKGEVIYERYKRGSEDNPYPAFSITKSVTSLLVGYALCQGHIKDLNDRASDYVPEIKGTVWGDARIVNLLKMKSGAPRQGLDAGGSYMSSSNSNRALLTGGNDVVTLIHQLNKLSDKGSQGHSWTYNSFDTLTLGLVLEAATKKKLTDFYKVNLWNDFKPEYPTYWFLDSKEVPLVDAYLHISLRDAARLGQFVLKISKGESGNSCMEKYIEKATQPHIQIKQIQGNRELLGYGYQFWLEVSHGDSVRMSGHQGQEIMINFNTGKVIAIFSAYNSSREKIYKSDGIFKWLSTDE